MTPRSAKRTQPYSSETSTTLKSLNVNFAESPTKKMKSRGDTCSQGEEDAESIALYQDSHVSPRSSLMKPWWNVDGEDIGRGLGVTSWNSRLNVWEIDLTEEEPSASGSTKVTMSSCGSREECRPSQQIAAARAEIAGTYQEERDQPARPLTK
eukprot:jgi/Phyca11/102602/e_gw1.7.544.1